MSIYVIDERATSGQIDPTYNLAENSVYIFTGSQDEVSVLDFGDCAIALADVKGGVDRS